MKNAQAPQGAQAALRAIRLLKLFTHERSELTLADLSRLSGLNKTTTHRLLRALSSESLIDRNHVSGAYTLGAGLMALGVQALSSSELRRRARPLLNTLARETGETATLEVPIESSMLILDEVTGNHFVGAAGNVGTQWPMHATSTGKILIANDETLADCLDSELRALTPKTITDRAKLDAELVRIRRRGFAETVDELEDGFSGVATLVRGGFGEVLGAISVCGPTARLNETRRARLGDTLRSAAVGLQTAA